MDGGKDGQFSIPLAQIRRANLKPDFAELLKRAEARNPKPDLMLSEEGEQDGEAEGEGSTAREFQDVTTGTPDGQESSAHPAPGQHAAGRKGPGKKARDARAAEQSRAPDSERARKGGNKQGANRANGGHRSL